MAEKDNDHGDDVNLEMPSLGFGRKRRKRKATPEASSDEDAEDAGREGAFVPPPPASPSTFRPPGDLTEERPLYADEAEDTTVLSSFEEPKPAKAAKPLKPTKPPKPPKPPREYTLPPVSGMTVSVFTGIFVGLLACGATYLALQGCEAIKGTSSCGGPGFFLLVAILILLVVIGSFIMKAFQVLDPASTAFLAVGLLAVIVLLFFVEAIFNWWMIIVIPLIGAGTFALSHWVTTTFIEPADNQPSA